MPTRKHITDDTFVSATSASPVGADTLLFLDATDNLIKKGLVSDLPSGGGSVYVSAQYTDGTAGTAVDGTTYVTIPMATADFEDTGFSNTSGVITVTDAGRYKIESFVTVSGSSINYRWIGRLAVVKGASTVLKEIDAGYIRGFNAAVSTTASIVITHVVDLAASDTIKIQLKKISAIGGNATTTSDNQLLITRLS